MKFDSIEYSKLSVPSFLKNIVSPPLVVEIPIKSFEIFLMNTVCLQAMHIMNLLQAFQKQLAIIVEI